MSRHDRHLSDSLFEVGFHKMEAGEYEEGLRTLRTAAGADHLQIGFEQGFGEYSPATGIGHLDEINKAARGHLQSHLEPGPVDPAAVVFMGAEEEFKGFIERRTGKSPDYRAKGFANHLGQAIAYYRRAEKMGYPPASWRLESLQLKLGSEDFRNAENSYNESASRARAHTNDLRQEILGSWGARQPAKASEKQGGCYIATAVYGSYDDPSVMTLRRFRDDHLATSPAGRLLIRCYYASSPALAKRLTADSPLTTVARHTLDGLVHFLDRRSPGS